MQAITTAKRIDWRTWVRGLISAIVSGGAGAFGGSLGAIIADPSHFTITGNGLHDTLTVATYAFIISGLVSLMKFLQTTPVPDEIPGNPDTP